MMKHVPSLRIYSVRAQPRLRRSTSQLLFEQAIISHHQPAVKLLKAMSSLWNSRKDVSEQTKNPRDLLTQSVISIAFGLSAFLTFCVSSFVDCAVSRSNTHMVYKLGIKTEMESSLCCSQKAERCCFQAAGIARYILWLDPRPL